MRFSLKANTKLHAGRVREVSMLKKKKTFTIKLERNVRAHLPAFMLGNSFLSLQTIKVSWKKRRGSVNFIT